MGAAPVAQQVPRADAGARGADTPGRFEFHCNVQDHYKGGMKGILEVQPKVGRLTQGELPIWRRRRALA